MPTIPSQNNNKIKNIVLFIIILVCIICILYIISTANAQLNEDFNSYPVGDLTGNGNWAGDTTFQVSPSVSFNGNASSITGIGMEKNIGVSITSSSTGYQYFWYYIDEDVASPSTDLLGKVSFYTDGDLAFRFDFYTTGVYVEGATYHQVGTSITNEWALCEVAWASNNYVARCYGYEDFSTSKNYFNSNTGAIDEIYLVGGQDLPDEDTIYWDNFHPSSSSGETIQDELIFTAPTGTYTGIIDIGLPISFEYTLESESDNGCWTGVEVDYYKLATESGNLSYESTQKRKYPLGEGINGTYYCYTGIIVSHSYDTYGEMFEEGYYMYRPRFYRDNYAGTDITASISRYYLPDEELGYYFTIGDWEYGVTSGSLDWDETIDTTASGMTYEVPNELRNRWPFAYMYDIKDILDDINEYFETASSGEQLTSISITIPEYFGMATTGYATLSAEEFSLPILDTTYIFQIIPEENWHTIRDLISTAITIGLFFTIYHTIKKIWDEHDTKD